MSLDVNSEMPSQLFPYPRHVMLPFHHRIPPNLNALHSVSAAKRAINSLEQLNRINMNLLKNRFTAPMPYLAEAFDAICPWIWAFISSIDASQEQDPEFSLRLLAASAVAISDFGNLDSCFVSKLRSHEDFRRDLSSALEWAHEHDLGAYCRLLDNTFLLYGESASTTLGSVVDAFGAFSSVTFSHGNTWDIRRYAEVIFSGIVEYQVPQTQTSEQCHSMMILCRKIRLLATALLEAEESPDSCVRCQISVMTAISYSLRTVAFLMRRQGPGGDSTLLRIALLEDLLTSIYRLHRFVLNEEEWGDWNGLENQAHEVALAIQDIVVHITSSACFPRIWRRVVKQLKNIEPDATRIFSGSLPLSATWSVMVEEVNRLQGLLLELCSNPQCHRSPTKWSDFGTCGGCREVLYCSEACQSAHWKTSEDSHRKSCSRRPHPSVHYSLTTERFLALVVRSDIRDRFHGTFKKYARSPSVLFTVVYGVYPPILRLTKKSRGADGVPLQNYNAQGIFYSNNISRVIVNTTVPLDA
ncbi:hypothetical protein AAF712_010907 [Marasmius tenuissimus]|uniref:MYND-type domain-containing protein n=1 Tax=Marasmius tenuissimus TaxID=585030 RepID=A0ABR2ZLV1_9AGAR